MNYDPAYLKPRPVVVRESTEVLIMAKSPQLELAKEIIKNLN